MSSTTDTNTHSSAEIERQVEGTRAGLAHTLDVLRERVSPDHLVDQAVQYVRSAGGDDFTRNLTKAVQANPLPVLLIGAGIGWMMMSGQKSASAPPAGSSVGARTQGGISAGTSTTSGTVSRVASSVGSSLGTAASSGREWTGQAAGSIQHAASSMASQAANATGNAYEAVSGAASDAADKIASGAGAAADHVTSFAQEAQHRASAMGSSMGSSVSTSTQGLQRLLHDQPLVLAALGVAVGAAVGALLPVTQVENNLLGSSSDALQEKAKSAAHDGLEQVQHAASEHLDKVKAAVADSFDHAQSHIKEGGLSPQTVGETLTTAAQELRKVVQDTTHEAAEQVRGAVASSAPSETTKPSV
ncbi:MAG: DUF3618 domain-containing protein [Janthinobacterium lividum]